MSFSEEHELKKLPTDITKLEQHVYELQVLLEDGTLYARDPVKFDAAIKLLAKTQGQLDAAEARWVELESRLAQ